MYPWKRRRSKRGSGLSLQASCKKARNPESAPNELETFLIREFNKNRNLTIWEDDSFVENIKYHFVARPVIFNESCMNCHGDPADAPVELIKLYGDKKGFHHTVGEIGGVVVAGFPVDMIKEPVRELTSQYIFFYLIGILLFALLISLFFDRVVMKNLHNLSTIFKTRFSGRQEQRIIERLKEKDEIEGLIEGIDELAICLSDARNELEGYTLNLEKEVANRTKEINVRAEKHRADVKLFVEILSKFGDSIDAEDVITGAIKSIGKRFGAEQVIYHCIVASNQSYAWKSEAGVKKSDDQILAQEFLDQTCLELSIDPMGIDPVALDYLSRQEWNGNVRELLNYIRRLAVFSNGKTIDISLIKFVEGENSIPVSGSRSDLRSYKDAKKEVMDLFSRNYLHILLTRTKGNISEASRLSGLERASIQKIIQRIGLNISDYRT